MCRFFDPIFAICVGSTAAAIRIRREQIAKYPEQENDFGTLWKKAQRMSRGYLTAYRNVEKQ
jgi:Non-classical export protein 1